MDISVPVNAPARSRAALFDRQEAVGTYLRWAVAALSLGAALVHFGYAPAHFEESNLHGATFLVMAWAQVALAIAVLARPSRGVLRATIVANTAFIALFVLAHTVGVPVEPNPWTLESASFPGLLAVGLEVALVVGAYALLNPHLARRAVPAAVGVTGVALLAVLVAGLSSASVAPALAGGHSHAAAGGDGGAAGAGGAAGGHTHAATGGGGAGGHGGAGGGAAAVGIEGANGQSPCEKTGPPVSEGQAAGGHGHRGPTITKAIEDPATRQLLGQELVIARDAALKLPTAADAKANGYRPVTNYLPCIGAHLMNFKYVDGEFNPAEPEMLLYDGNGDDARVVGLSYYVVSGQQAPEGFAGPNDPWHQHIGLCIRGGLVVGSEKTTAEECAGRGGVKANGSDAWMNHVWAVPGWESPWGMFSGEHPELGAAVPH